MDSQNNKDKILYIMHSINELKTIDLWSHSESFVQTDSAMGGGRGGQRRKD